MSFAIAPLLGAVGVEASTAATISAAAGVVGAGASALGAISQGGAQARQASYEAQVAQNNAAIAAQNANYTTAAGEERATIEGLKQRQLAGYERARIAAGGIDVNTGSAADVRQSQAELGQLDTEQTRADAALRAYGYRTQQTNYEAQSRLDTQQAGYARTTGWLRGLGGLLSASPQLPFKFGGGATPFNPDAFDELGE